MLCIDNLEECLKENYKTINNSCYNECPENTELKSDNPNNCLCKYNYYNKINLLECYEPSDSCEIKNYAFKKYDNNECFKT